MNMVGIMISEATHVPIESVPLWGGTGVETPTGVATLLVTSTSTFEDSKHLLCDRPLRIQQNEDRATWALDENATPLSPEADALHEAGKRAFQHWQGENRA